MDLTGFPEAPHELTRGVVAGWASRLELTARGFGNNSAAYFRFEGHLDLPAETPGDPADPVVLIDSATGELLPLELRFIDDPMGDPFYARHTLALAPATGSPPASGATLVAAVLASAGAESPAGWTPDQGVLDALSLAGIDSAPAIATTFTVQDVTLQLQQLVHDVDSRLDAAGDDGPWGTVTLRRVTSITYAQGETASGEAGTACTVTFEDGSTETNWLAALNEDEGNHTTDLGEGWPMAVYQAEIPVLNYSGLDDRPYMSPGMAHLTDTDRISGWIDFSAEGLVSEPEVESMRIVVSLPKGSDGVPLDDVPLVLYDHGTGGHAYNSVQRRNVNDNGAALASVYANAGWGVIGRDAALYGTRYPLIEEGYSGGSLGFYNIVNLPAFRDNQRQTAVDGHVLQRFVQTGLGDVLPAGSVDPTRVRRLGHSLGSVTSNLGLAADPQSYADTLLSGTGGIFTHYFLSTGLIGVIDSSVVASLFTLFGAEVPEEVTPPALLGAALGLEEAAWVNLDRLHPVLTLFQWTMDPSDPMATARDEETPTLVFIGLGDYQVPNFTSEALARALPRSTVVECTALDDYDPHYCLHREPEGWAALADWLAR